MCAVNIHDELLYGITKEEAHKNGILHRAFSVVLYNNKDILIQKRADDKYHCGGLWSNTCCSHPRLNEETKQAVIRRLDEELGIKNVSCQLLGNMTYYYQFDNGLKEYEYDHIYLGEYSGEVQINKSEVSEVKWININELIELIQKKPEIFTPWAIVLFTKIYDYIN